MKGLPLKLSAKGQIYHLVDYEKPEGDYLMLESLYHDKNNSRIVYLLKPNQKQQTFKLGRGHDSDLRYNDISLSRVHSIIKFDNGVWTLQDNNSKFGTLVLVKQRTPLLMGFPKSVQIGRTMVKLSIETNAEAEASKGNQTFPEMFWAIILIQKLF